MNVTSKLSCVVVLLGLIAFIGCQYVTPGDTPQAATDARPITLLVMDPLSLELACPCVEGFAQRNYHALGKHLARQLGRPVNVAFHGTLAEAEAEGLWATSDVVVIGKQTMVAHDLKNSPHEAERIAMLTGLEGKTTLTGLLVVRADDPAQSVKDIAGSRIVFGPSFEHEKSLAAFELLKAEGVAVPQQVETAPGCNIAALQVFEKKADVAVISSYAMPLLTGCGTIDAGALRQVGETKPVPFIAAFADARLTEAQRAAIRAALLTVKRDAELCKVMETRDGFVPVKAAGEPPPKLSSTWPDWRGPNRDGLAASLPDRLPDEAVFLWRKPLHSIALAGVCATKDRVIVADKTADGLRDRWVCFDAGTGKQLWQHAYDYHAAMDYGNAPRATAVLHDGVAYLLGAGGHLHAVKADTGDLVWQRHLADEFGATVPTWGYCATPLLVGDRLIVNPGGKGAAVVALDRRTGKTLWRGEGDAAAYGAFIHANVHGVEQVIGYDATTAGGWSVKTGQRLWSLTPPEEFDFNVPTPVLLPGHRLLLATENNGTRTYTFDQHGKLNPTPLAVNEDAVPDTTSPVVIGRRVFSSGLGAMLCLDLADNLKTIWETEDGPFDEHVSLIASPTRVLVTTIGAELILLDPTADDYKPLSHLKPFDQAECWSHPALVGDRLYIRTQNEIACLSLAR